MFIKDGDLLIDDWLMVVCGEGFGDLVMSCVFRFEFVLFVGLKFMIEDFEVDSILV